VSFVLYVYRTRFPGRFFELSSCGSLEGKQGLLSPPRGLEMELFHQPLLVVAVAEFSQSFGQLHHHVKAPRGQELLLAGGAGG